MKAVKGNKVYTIDESMKARYLADGFDVLDDSGKLIAAGKGKTVSYEEYQRVLDELNALKAEKQDNDAEQEWDAPGLDVDALEGMDLDMLKAYAEENDIDLGKANTKEGIVKKITKRQYIFYFSSQLG